MKRSDEAARIYAALALRATGRPVDHQAVAGICDQLGLPHDLQAVTALVHVFAVERQERLEPSASAQTVADRDAAAETSAPEKLGMSGLEVSGRRDAGRTDRESHSAAAASATAEGLAPWAAIPSEPPPEMEEAFYLYGIVEGEPLLAGDLAGIEGSQVEAISFDGVTGLGHPCPAVPYSAADAEIVIGWVEEHDAVLRQTLSASAAVVPCKFNTMIKSGDRTAREAVRAWLEERQDELKALFARVRGRLEYGVRVLWQPSAGQEGTTREPSVEDSADSGATLPPGVQYLMQEQVKRRSAEQRRLAQADIRARCLAAIAAQTDGIAEQRRDGAEEEEDLLVLRCACLVATDMSAGFFEVLDHLRTIEHVTIQVTGPWPAYSFVGDPAPGAAAQ